MPAPLPPSADLRDPERLRRLHALQLLVRPSHPALDRLTRLAARLLGVPVCLVSLVDAERQSFAGSTGLPAPWSTTRQTPLSHSFCQHVVIDRAPFVVVDARAHPRVATNRAIPDMGVIAYAGVPLTTPDGLVLGALCAIDHAPRDWSDADLDLLADLAASVMTELALNQAQQAAQQAAHGQHHAEARLAAVLAQVPDAIWSVDHTYAITGCNQVSVALAAQLTGHTLAPGASFTALCPPGQDAIWKAHYDRALAGERFAVEDCVVLSGVPRWLDLMFSPIQHDGGVEGVAVVGRDVTARRGETDALRSLAAENARLYAAEHVARLATERAAARAARHAALTAALAGARTPADVAELTVAQGVAALGAYAGVFVLPMGDAADLRLAAAVGYPPETIAAWPVVPADAPLPIAAAFRTRQPVWLPDRAAMADAYPALTQLLTPTTQAQAAIPLCSGGAVVGVIGLSFTAPQPFDADDRALILAIAEQCAQALDRARLLESLQRELAERLRAEATLRLRDRAIAASTSGIVIIDAQHPDAPVIFCNPAFTTLTGYPADEMLGRNCRFLQGPDTDPAARAAIRRALAAGEPIQITLRNYRRDGTPFWNDLAIAPVHDGAGRLTHFVGIQTDVTARVEAMEALRASEERFARAVAASPIALCIATLTDGQIFEANAGFAALGGVPQAALRGQRLADLPIWATPADYPQLLDALAAQPAVQGHEVRFHTAAGVRTGLVAATTIELRGARCLLLQVQDISALKVAELAVRASEARFRSLAESAPDCIYVVDMATRSLVYCNRESFLGYPLATLRQPGGLFAAVHPDDRAAVGAHWSALTGAPDDHTQLVEYRMQRADGAWEWLQSRGTVLDRDAAGQPVELMVSISVVTERREAEEARRALDRALLETQKLESLGVLAGGIAHDFNNMLVAMLGNAELALLDLPADHPATPSVQHIQVAAQRAADLTGQLLAYSGRGRFVVGPLDLAQLVREMAGLLRASTARTVTLDLATDGPAPLIEGDATQLRQVVMNLVINAAEATGPAGGTVRVRVQERHVERADLADCVLGADAAPGPYLALEVADRGCGMDAATLRRIFEPFFTTKFTGRGLGMAAVQGIVRAHQGAIRIVSAVGRGTTITVLLPCPASPLRAPLPSPAAASATVPAMQQMLLVVDDEPEVRQVVTAMLERMGYQVRAASDGAAALALLDVEPGIAGVLLDLTMPGMSGEATFERLRQRWPGLPVVVVSGYSEQEVRGRLSSSAPVDVLQKPFTPTALRQVLARMLPHRP